MFVFLHTIWQINERKQTEMFYVFLFATEMNLKESV